MRGGTLSFWSKMSTGYSQTNQQITSKLVPLKQEMRRSMQGTTYSTPSNAIESSEKESKKG